MTVTTLCLAGYVAGHMTAGGLTVSGLDLIVYLPTFLTTTHA